MIKKMIFVVLGFLLLFILAIAQSAIVPPIDPDDTKVVKGRVVRIFEGQGNDIVFKLEDHSTTYYINRGLEQGYQLFPLRTQLLYKQVSIRYPKYWTPLDMSGSVRHLSELVLVHSDSVIFSEIDWDKAD